MAIPNDPVIEETISPVITNENVIPEEQVIAKDSDIDGNEILNSEQQYEKHASLSKGISKVTRTVTDGVSNFFESGADTLVSPAVKKQKIKGIVVAHSVYVSGIPSRIAEYKNILN